LRFRSANVKLERVLISSSKDDPDRLAQDTLRAIEKNKALLVKPRLAHAQWLFARLAPTLMNRVSVGFIERQRASQAAARQQIS
jgi:hypothetical protein